VASSTTEHAVHLGVDPATARVVARRRWLHRGTIGLVSLILGLAVLDGADLVEAYGVDQATVTATAGDVRLRVTYPAVTRPALASPFRIEVEREGGWGAEPVELAIDRGYLEAWDLNGVLPSPASERSAGDVVLWELEPPEGDRLVVVYEARIEPTLQTGRSGRVAVVEDGERVVEVAFHTAVRP
jgi:hypothetical protein